MKDFRLLVVDDDPDFAESLALALGLDGLRVDTVSKGESGVEAARHTAYDAILIDIGLPGINGVETLVRIKEFDPNVRCYLVTGHSADHLFKQGIDAGAIEVLTKPLDPEVLSRKITAT